MTAKTSGFLLLLAALSASCNLFDPLVKTIQSPTGVNLGLGRYSLVRNFAMNFVPSVTPKEAQNTKFNLTSSNPASISLSGNRASSLAVGTSLVTATTVAGGLTATAQIDAVNWSAINPSGVVSHFAGSNDSVGSTDGSTGSARFFNPNGVCLVGTSTLFVADSQNMTIRQINLSTSTVTTLAGSPGLQAVTNGTGSAARFAYPSAICSDGVNLYVTDQYGNTVRKIVISTGVVTTLAGGTQGSADGVGAAAQFQNPSGICTDNTNLYVTDGNATIRKIVISTATVTTIAGASGQQGSADGIGTSARFNSPSAVATDGSNLYVCDSQNDTIRKIVLSTLQVTTFVGSAGQNNSTDGIGVSARLGSPQGIYCDNTYLYVSDSYGATIRKIVIATAAVSTLAGGFPNGAADGAGTSAQFGSARGLAYGGGVLYVADTNNNTIRAVDTGGSVSTLAGRASAGFANSAGTAARFNFPSGICSDQTSLFVVDQNNFVIRRIDPGSGNVTTLVGTPGRNDGGTDGTGSNALFAGPRALCTDGISLFVVDQYGSKIRRVVIFTGVVKTLTQVDNAQGICTDGVFLYVTLGSNSILKVSIDDGSTTTLVSGLNDPQQLCTDGTMLYVTEGNANLVLKIDPSTGARSTLSGNGSGGEVDGAAGVAQFNHPTGVTTDGSSLFVSDQYGNNIRKVSISTGAVTTLAGANAPGNADGSGTSASFQQPAGLCSFGSSLYVTDQGNNCIRQIQ